MKSCLQKTNKYAIRISMIFFMTSCATLLMASATGNAQKVLAKKSIKEIYVTVEFAENNAVEVFKKLENQTEFTFVYNIDAISKDKLTANHRNSSLYDVLVNISDKMGLVFKRVDATINVKRQKKSKKDEVIEEVLVIDVKGQVNNSENVGLPGVTVLEKGTSNGTITDANGEYNISVNEDAVLVFSYVGFGTQEISVNGRSIVDASMVEDISQLAELVVVGYGTVQKRDLTGSVSQVKGEELESIPTSRVDQILQGRASGVQVTQSSGEPGAAPSIRIRGGNSIQGDNEPLWVIDGIIVGTNFDLNNINTNDIESVDILKDAVAVSIYGTRGANGVVLITTKNGTGSNQQGPQVTFNAYRGVQSLVTDVDFLNGREHAEYANDDATFRQAAVPFANLNSVPDVDWLDQITDNASMSNVDISVGGRSKDRDINYYFSGNYFNQDGIIRNSGIERYAFRANLDNQISKTVKAGFRINIANTERENNKVDIANLFDNGVPSRGILDANGLFTTENPVSASIARNHEADVQLKVDESTTTNILGNIYLEVSPSDKFIFRTTFSPEINSFKRNQFNPGSLPENFVINDGGDARVRTITSLGYINENTVTYTNDFGDAGTLTALGGFTIQKFTEDSTSTQAFGFSNDVTSFNNLGFGSDPTRNVVGSGFDSFQLVSWLGRVNYTLNNKYLFTVVGRLDGSSRFADGNRYAFFPSAAFGWRLSEENFIRDMNVFDDLKLRLSYGLSGSQAIPSFRTFALLDNSNTTFNGTEQAGVVLGRPSNDELKWETTRQFDVGLEAGFLEGRLNMEIDYYYKKTADLLLDVQLPRQSGFNSRLQNLGEIKNSGIEFLVNSVNVSKGDFTWSSTLTLSANRNKVLDLAGVDFINIQTLNQSGVGGRLIIGESAPVFVGVPYLGTWKSQEEIDAAGIGGDHDIGGPRFEDINGDGEVNEDDFIVLGSPQPDFYYGIGNSISYKNWSLDFFFQGTQGNEVYNSLTQTAYFGRSETNKYKETLDRWTPQNSDSDIPAAGAVAALSEVWNNSVMIEDGSHIRLKSLKLAYNVPTQKLSLNGINSLSLYFTATNLFVISGFRLKDPETGQFGRDNLRGGFTQGEYPSARTVSFGAKAGF